MTLSRDDQTPAVFDPALHQVRFTMLDGTKRVLGYVSVQALMNGGNREPSDAASTPVEIFGRFRDRIEKAASDEYEKGNFSKSQMRDAAPVWVANVLKPIRPSPSHMQWLSSNHGADLAA